MSALHTVAITGTPDAARIEFTCHADSVASCRYYPACKCESWTDDHHHPSVIHDQCWMQAWFDNDGTDPIAECLDEHDYTVGMSGPIKTYFCEDYIEWEFVTEEAQS